MFQILFRYCVPDTISQMVKLKGSEGNFLKVTQLSSDKSHNFNPSCLAPESTLLTTLQIILILLNSHLSAMGKTS